MIKPPLNSGGEVTLRRANLDCTGFLLIVEPKVDSIYKGGGRL
jgi:hypothetical protein